MLLAMCTDEGRIKREWRAADYNLNCELSSTGALLLCILREQVESREGLRGLQKSSLARGVSTRIDTNIASAKVGGPDLTGRLCFSLGPRDGFQIVEEHNVKK